MLLIGLVKVLWFPVSTIMSALPTFSPPASLLAGGSGFAGMGYLGAQSSSMSAWIDFSQVAAVVVVMVGVCATSVGIFLVRRVGAALPFIGGFFQD
jgi:hypothetical protein